MPESCAPSSQFPAGDERFRILIEGVRDYAIFLVDPDGRVLTWNLGAELIMGYKADEIVGGHFAQFYPPESLAGGLPDKELGTAAKEGRFEDESWRVRKSGALFWANVIVTALHDRHGNLIGYAKITRDLTSRRDHEETLRRSEERFRLLVEGMSEYAIFMLDPDGNVVTWNTGAERIKGYRASEILGQNFRKFYPLDAMETGWPEHELEAATAEGRFTDEGWRVRKDGSRFWAHVTITALRDDHGRLRGFAKLTRDLTERRRAEALEASGTQREALLDAERRARMEAQRAARVKDDFLATLSHELRTPLNAILGWAQILRMGSSHADVERGMEVIERNARSQVQMIDDLLDLSRIMAGRIRLDVGQVHLIDVVTGAIESIEPAANAKGIRLERVLDPKGGIISGDSGRMQQVIWNLLSNAIKFTPKGGRVQVILQRVNSHIELSVSDTGAGIPASFLPHVFDRFAQEDTSTNRKYSGLGLGLAISKQLVELHGGTIQAKSLGEGRGATFIVNLPLFIQDTEIENRVHPESGLIADSREAVPDLHGLRILAVDDENDSLDLVCRALEAQGAIVTAATSAEVAFAALSRGAPDLIISDIGMPDVDGHQFMRRLRASEGRDRRIPALALTAFARPEDRKRAILAGYQAHLAKPFDVAELAIVIAGLTGKI